MRHGQAEILFEDNKWDKKSEHVNGFPRVVCLRARSSSFSRARAREAIVRRVIIYTNIFAPSPAVRSARAGFLIYAPAARDIFHFRDITRRRTARGELQGRSIVGRDGRIYLRVFLSNRGYIFCSIICGRVGRGIFFFFFRTRGAEGFTRRWYLFIYLLFVSPRDQS